MSVGAFAATAASVIINGTACSFVEDPFVDNGVVYVPLRGILESLGAKVSWESFSKSVTAVKGNTRVVIASGTRFMRVNGKSVDMGGMLKLVDGTSMVPVRAVSEAFDATVEYSPASGQVSISVIGASLNLDKVDSGVQSTNTTTVNSAIDESTVELREKSMDITADDGTVLATLNVSYPYITSTGWVAKTANESISELLTKTLGNISDNNKVTLVKKYNADKSAYKPVVLTGVSEIGDITKTYIGIKLNISGGERLVMRDYYAATISLSSGKSVTLKEISGLNEKTAQNVVLNKYKELFNGSLAKYRTDALSVVRNKLEDAQYYVKDSVVEVSVPSGLTGCASERQCAVSVPLSLTDKIKTGGDASVRKYVVDCGLNYLDTDSYVKAVIVPYTGYPANKYRVLVNSDTLRIDGMKYISVYVKASTGEVSQFALSEDYKELKVYDDESQSYVTVK
jgi:hypothetical protein